MFEAIQEAYELLLPVVERGGMITAKISTDEITTEDNLDSSVSVFDGLGGGRDQMETMHLLIRTQLLICKRYADDMRKYKYPAYRMLLGCLEIPSSCRDVDLENPLSITNSCLLATERAEFVRTATDLVFYTCLVSPLNAEELISEGGVPTLEALMNFYVDAARVACSTSTTNTIPKQKSALLASDKLIIKILSNLVHTLAGVSFYENGRNSLLALPDDGLVADVLCDASEEPTATLLSLLELPNDYEVRYYCFVRNLLHVRSLPMSSFF